MYNLYKSFGMRLFFACVFSLGSLAAPVLMLLSAKIKGGPNKAEAKRVLEAVLRCAFLNLAVLAFSLLDSTITRPAAS